MINTLDLLFISITVGAIALLFAILSWRLKTEITFWIGLGFTFILLVIDTINFDAVLFLFSNSATIFSGVIISLCLMLPICFLIASKLNSKKSQKDSDITDDYLNDIINSEDEKIDFEY